MDEERNEGWMIPKGADVLVNHPQFGSLWLTNVEVFRGHVIGEAEDRRSVTGYSTMNFPLSCVRKVSQ